MPLPLTIRPALRSDLPAILDIMASGRTIMCQSGNPTQWPEGTPSREQLLADIDGGVSYVAEKDGEPVASFAFVPGPDSTYGRIDGGAWLDDKAPYFVVHRLAKRQGVKGVFERVVAFCLGHTDNLRIDTHRDNRIMQTLLCRNGFAYCGIIYLHDGQERLAYQKLKEKKAAR